jgi:nucleolar protein 56
VRRVFLVTEWFGAFLVEGGRVREAQLFPKEPDEVARRLQAIDAGGVLDEERALAQGQAVQVAESRLLQLPGAKLAAKPPSVRADAAERGYSAQLFRASVLAFGRAKAQQAMGGRDQQVVQAVQASDDLAEAANLLAERLREWYGLHFPESDRMVQRHEEMATLISTHVTRDAILAASPHLRMERPSFGAELGAEERETVRGLARSLSALYAQRAELDKYLERAMPGVAPNVTQLVGAAVAARLLYHAGGLHDLARMPSGTIQTLGAEKALFRHLKEGNRPPKHGVIFQHPLIHRSPPRQRGAVARALAGKIAIAARADAYTHNDVATELLKSFAARVEAVRARPMRPRGPMSKGREPSRGPPPSSHARPGQGAPRGPQAARGPPPRGPPSRGAPPRGRPPPYGRDPPPRRDDRDRRRRP